MVAARGPGVGTVCAVLGVVGEAPGGGAARCGRLAVVGLGHAHPVVCVCGARARQSS